MTRLERSALATGEKAADGESVLAPDREWRLVAPLAAPADGDAVADLLAELIGLERERTLEEVDADSLGLSAPRATVVVQTAESSWTLLVGEEVPASSNLIAAIAAAPEADLVEAYVVADRFWSDLVKPAADWRSRQAFAAARSDVVAVRLWGTNEVELHRGEDGFVVAAPFADEADRAAVDALLSALTDLEVATFVDGTVAADALGLEPATTGLTVTLADGTQTEIRLGSPAAAGDSTRYVAVDELRFTATTELAELVDRDPAAWRSTAWSRFQVYEVDAVEVRHGDAPLRLERVAGNWRRDGVEIAYTTASDLLYALVDAEVERLIERAAIALGEPMIEIALTAEGGDEVLRLYPPSDGAHPAERAGRDPILLLSAGSVDDLVAKIEAVRSAQEVPAAPQDGVAEAAPGTSS